MTERSDDASVVSCLSAVSTGIANEVRFFNDDDVEPTILKRKSSPKRYGGEGERFVLLWIKPSKDVTPQENLFQAVVKVIKIVRTADSRACFLCVFNNEEACWFGPETNHEELIKQITCSSDVPEDAGIMERYFKVIWEKMMLDQ